MIQIGDLVRAKNRIIWANAGVFLVLEKAEGYLRRKEGGSMMALCAQGSRRIWLYVRDLEKL